MVEVFFLDPKILFVLWFLVPGFLAVYLIFFLIKIFYPTLKINYFDIKFLEKIIFSFLVSSIIFAAIGILFIQLSYNFNIETNLELLLSNFNVFFIFVICSLIFSGVFSLFFMLFINLANSIGYSLSYSLHFIHYKPRYTHLETCGPPWDLRKETIEKAFEKERQITVILKNQNKIKGKIIDLSRDFSQFNIKNKKNITTINYNQIDLLSVEIEKDKNRILRDFYKTNIKSILNAFIWYLFFILLFLYLKQYLLLSIIIIIILWQTFILIKICVLFKKVKTKLKKNKKLRKK